MEYLLIWIVFACAAYSIAQGKGRNAKLWFAVGLVLGPFAALILAVIPASSDAKGGYK
ncbi:MAG: antitermination protein NusB [Deltaproteobacteria bacterium]|jgi:hypothetical protein|nr:antitermination protein NusB [Deltaproteobacteria bacterium]MCW9049069.1 antitermination protein NusB [Deltaproteobacteria bacterium]